MSLEQIPSQESSEPEIVTLGEDQWEIYKRLRLEALKEPTAFRNTPEEEKDLPEEAWRSDLRKTAEGREIFLFAKEGEEYVGMAGASFFSSEKMRHVASVHDVFVDSAARGGGVGMKLMTELVERIQREHPQTEKLELNVFSSQEAAIRLYEKLGFKEVGRWTKRLKVSGKYYDHLMMERFLKESR